MVVKVAMADHFQFKVMPSIKNFCLLKQGEIGRASCSERV